MTKKNFIALADTIKAQNSNPYDTSEDTMLFPISGRSQAYVDGFKAGRADKLIGWRSRYIWATQQHEGEYVWNYAIGYRTAQLGQAF